MSNVYAYIYNTERRIIGEKYGDENAIQVELIEEDLQAVIKDTPIQGEINDYYVTYLGTLEKKQNLSTLKYDEIVNVGENLVISGFPPNTKITWPSGLIEVIQEEEITVSVTEPGIFVFVIDHVYYFPETIVINTNPEYVEPPEEPSVNIEDINATGTPDATSYLRGDGSWSVVDTSGGSWGELTGLLSDQTDLQGALNLKANADALGTVSPLDLNSSTTQYLRGDGIWAIPPDTNTDTDTLQSVTDRGATTTNSITVAGIQTSGLSRFTGAVDQTALGIDRIDIGVQGGTPRMVFEDAEGTTTWMIDNAGGTFRWFTPGVERMTLTASGALTAASFIGNGSGLTALNATQLTSGTVPVSSLPTTINADTVDDLHGYQLTRSDTTMLGKTGSVGLDSVTNTAAEWGALPVGYSRMMSNTIGTTGGAPVNNHGYFTKVANRDTAGGWAGLWLGYVSGENYIGRTSTSAGFATWDKIWSSSNDGAGSGLDADLLDGNHASAFALAHSHPYLPLAGGTLTGAVNPIAFVGPSSTTSRGYSGNGYAWGYQEIGAWTHPYPDLVIGYHTGMKLGGSISYGGVRFYRDHPHISNVELFSIGNGDVHVRVANNLIVSGIISGNGASITDVDAEKLDGSDWLDYKRVNGSDFYASGWFRSNSSGNGLYNQATGQHFYSDHDDYWNIAGGTGANALRFRDEHGGTIRGYVYANNANDIGFLNNEAGWALRCSNGTVFATTFSGSGSGLTSLNASNLSSGTVPVARIPSLSYLPTAGGIVNGSLSLTGNNSRIRICNGTSGTANVGHCIEMATDTSFGGVHNDHTGIRMFAYGMNGWGTAKLGIQVGTNWGTYWGGNTNIPDSDMAMIIGHHGVKIRSTTTGADFVATSDIRLKDNIEPLDPFDCLDQTNRLIPSSFTWKESGKFDTGFIAQQVQEVLPERVTGDDELAVSYAKITTQLVGAVQALTKQNKLLIKRIEELEAR